MRRSVPFTVTRIIDRGTASVATPAAGVTASAAPVPFRNFRREIFFFGLDLLMEEYCSAVGARLTRILDLSDFKISTYRAYLTITARARSIWAAVRSSVFATTTICSLASFQL